MHGVPPRGHFQGQTRDNSNTRFFHTKKEHIYMCSYIISVIYIYIVLYLVWRGLFCFIIFHTPMECICRWKFIKNIKNIVHRSWQHFKMIFLWRYGREICYTLELIQTVYATKDKEDGVDFYNSVFPGEAKVLWFHEFSRTFHSNKTEKLS